MNGMFVKVARRSSLAQIQHVSPIRPVHASGLVAQVYAQVEREFGMLAPPIALHAPAPEPLAASWLMLRETLLATGLVSRAAKEAVGTGVSLGNTCPYCVEVHSATLGGLIRGGSGTSTDGGLDTDGDAAALSAGRFDSIADPGARALAAWAKACGRRDTVDRASPTNQPRRPPRHEAPFQEDQAPELIGVAVTFHYLNRMVNVFLRESPFPPSLPTTARGRLMRLLVKVLGPTTRTARRPGLSLDLLPAAPLPNDLSWAAGHSHVAGAFARVAAAIEAAGARSVPETVRDLVMARLAGWDGDPPGPSRAWADDAVSGLPVADRSAGRLALLTTLASYQVGPSVIEEFRRDHPDDETLIDLTAWASLAAARQVGHWTGDSLPAQRAFNIND